jgi:hypothetical protein
MYVIKNASDIVLNLIKRNFEVLFSKNDFSINMDATGPAINAEVIIYKEASVKFEIDPGDLKPVAFSMYAGLASLDDQDMTQLLSDMTRTSNAVLNTLRCISIRGAKKEYVVFSTDEYVITTAFTDIGFTDKKGNRSLLVHRGKKFSYITFDSQGNAITSEVPNDKLCDFIVSVSKGTVIDTYQDIGIIYFVNWLNYQDEEDENNDIE